MGGTAFDSRQRQEFSLHQSVGTVSGAHLAPCPVASSGSFLRGKAAGAGN